MTERLTVFVTHRIDGEQGCQGCPFAYWERGRLLCGKRGGRDASYGERIPEWCPLRSEDSTIDLTGCDPDAVARLIVACDKYLAETEDP